MIDAILPILETYLFHPFLEGWYYPLIALAFLGCVAPLIRSFCR